MKIFSKINICVLALFSSGICYAAAEVKQPEIFNTANIKWIDAKDMPPGVKVAVLTGDPSKNEHFIARIKFPANYIVPAHSHAINEEDTVISGTYYLGTGDVADANKGVALHTGDFAMIPANTKHYGWTKGETVIEISADGPWGMLYETNG
jgi:quercetin dioxygenase-like cupin family protein